MGKDKEILKRIIDLEADIRHYKTETIAFGVGSTFAFLLSATLRLTIGLIISAGCFLICIPFAIKWMNLNSEITKLRSALQQQNPADQGEVTHTNTQTVSDYTCPNCGKIIKRDVSFCKYCGRKIN